MSTPPVLGQIVTPAEARRLLSEYPGYAWAWRRKENEAWSAAYKLTAEDIYEDEQYACIGVMPEEVKLEGWMVVEQISGQDVKGRVFSTYDDAKVHQARVNSPYHVVPYALHMTMSDLEKATEQ